jgi:hypothetical protein
VEIFLGRILLDKEERSLRTTFAPDGEISEGYLDPMIETLNATRSLAATPFETYNFKGLNS